MKDEQFIEEFVHATKEIDFIKFFRARRQNECIITDALFFEYIKRCLEKQSSILECGLCEADKIDGFLTAHETVINFFVLSHGNELALTRGLRKKYSTKQFFSMKNDIAPYLLCSNPTHFYDRCSEVWDVPYVYAILSIPRSGSSYLCDLMARQGLGSPKEHLRSPLRYMIRKLNQDDFDLNYFMRRLIVAEGDEEIFGTKAISQFLLTAAGGMSERNLALLKAMHPKIIYLYREDKVLQAVSAVMGMQAGKWHAYSAEQAEKLNRKEVQYEFKMILEQYHQLVEQERKMVAFIEKLSTPFLAVSYEKELEQDPEQTISKIVDYIGCHSRHENNDIIVRKRLRTSLSYDYADRFRKEYNRKGV